ncbi:hypothetical protein BJY52DRAFT_1151533 [Lactarius psammicola]|nr:hypothetical protein BJY52DRAFT_1151533 [Lactarius psammicola]
MSVLGTVVTSNAALAANDIRIASLAIAGYDYILTLPAEWRFYKAFYRSNFRFKCLINATLTSENATNYLCSASLVLFVLIRYTSVLAGSLGSWTFLSHGFTPESCHRFYLLPTLLRIPQCMISQAILGLR